MKKSSCLLYVRLQSFHYNTELIMNSSCMSFCKLPRHPLWRTYQWLFYRASKSSIVINVLVVLRQVLGLMQFIIFRHIFVLKGFLLLMSWDPVASLNFPLEKSTASFSRCSGILLAGSEIGKSKGIELSMGSTVTIKDMTTLEGQMGKMYTATCLAVSIDSKSKIIFQVEQRLLSGIPKPRVSDPHKKSLQKV